MTWRAVAQRLGERQAAPVVAPEASAWQVRAPFIPSLAARLAAQLPAETERWIIVGHSAAGGVLPALAEAVAERVVGAIFVDAILPHPGQSWIDTAPPALRRVVSGGAGAGVAPAWTAWHPAGVLERLIPDPDERAAFRREVHGVPLRYFEEPAPQARHWPPGPCAYVRLSAGYELEAAAAERHWPVERLDAHHLAMLTEPDMVAEAILHMVARIEAAA